MIKPLTSKKGAAAEWQENGQLKPAKDNPSKLELTTNTTAGMAMLDPVDGLQQLLEDHIRQAYWAENYLLIFLPRMVKAVSLKSLQEAMRDHIAATKTHVERLEKIFEMLGKSPQAKKCEALEGLAKDGEAVAETTDEDTPARNMGIIMGGQKIEDFEMVTYEGLIKLAIMLNLEDIANILTETLVEEQQAYKSLGIIADMDIIAANDDATNMEATGNEEA